MFLEESTVGRDVLRLAFSSLLCKIATLLHDIMKEEATINSAMCYQTVKVGILTWSQAYVYLLDISHLCSDGRVSARFLGVSADVPAVAWASGGSGLFRAERHSVYEGDSAIPGECCLGTGACFSSVWRFLLRDYACKECITLARVCQTYNRETRLLAGTAAAMLISVAPDGESAASSASSLLQLSSTGERLLYSRVLRSTCH